MANLTKQPFVLSLCLLVIAHLGMTIILPFPTTFGDIFSFELQLTVPYSIAFPKYDTFYRKKRYISNNDHVADMSDEEGVKFAKLHSIFQWMGLQDHECHKRFLCMLLENSTKYSPLSDVIVQHLEPFKYFKDNMTTATSNFTDYLGYYVSELKGLNCLKESAKCRTNPDEILNWNMIKLLKTLTQFVSLKLN